METKCQRWVGCDVDGVEVGFDGTVTTVVGEQRLDSGLQWLGCGRGLTGNPGRERLGTNNLGQTQADLDTDWVQVDWAELGAGRRIERR